MKQVLLLLLSVIVAGCNLMADYRRAQADEVVTAWAEAYFNYDFKQAMEYTTADSEQWLRFAASNVQQADVELLAAQAMPATVEIEGYEMESDSVGVAFLRVRNYLLPDPIGQVGHLLDEGIFRVGIVRHDGTWSVRMAGLPQNEKQSHD